MFYKSNLLTFLALLFWSCLFGSAFAAEPPGYIQAFYLHDISGKIRILRQADMDEIPPNATWDTILTRFGEPFPGTIGALTWPKDREDIDNATESESLIWTNGYWFIFDDYLHNFGRAKLLFVASFRKRTVLTNSPIVDEIQNMTIDWPLSAAGMEVKKYWRKMKQ